MQSKDEYNRLSLLETAELAHELTSQDWNNLNYPKSNESTSRIINASDNKNHNNEEADKHNISNKQRRQSPFMRNLRNHVDRYTENILALLHIRLIAILYIREETPKLPNFRDLSTTTISRTIMAVEARRLSSDRQRSRVEPLDWPEKLSIQVSQQLRCYIYKTLSMYRNVFYHNCEHAHHVFLSANKLLDSVLCEMVWVSLKIDRPRRKSVEWMEISFNAPTEAQHQEMIDEKIERSKVEPHPKRRRPTFGIKSDPVMHLGFLFSALVHDVDHKGVSNRQLVNESDEIALMYNDQSVQEQRSLAIAFTLLMKEEYNALRIACFKDRKEFLGFRSNVINLVLCTDISNPERVQILKSKWSAAFGDNRKFPRPNEKFDELNERSIMQRQRGSKSQPQIFSNSSRRNLFRSSMYGSHHSANPELFGSKRGLSGSKRNLMESKRQLVESMPQKDVFETNASSGTTMNSELQEEFPFRLPRVLDPDLDTSLSSDAKQIVGKLGVEGKDESFEFEDGSDHSLGIRKALDRSGDVIETYGDDNPATSDPDLPNTLKANVILELMLNTADIGANMQKFDTMLKWSANLFDELKTSFVAGRGADPGKGWHAQQIGFFESYVLPLASSITEIEILEQDVAAQIRFHVLENHIRWKIEGMKYVDRMVHPWTQLPVEIFTFRNTNSNKNDLSDDISLRNVIGNIRDEKDSKQIVLPTHIIIPQEESYAMSETERYKNVSMSNKVAELESDPFFRVDVETISGLRYVLACYVMFMSIGSDKSWGSFANLRYLPWHEHVFFLLGGFSMALPMNPIIVTKFDFVKSRIKAMYPMYLCAVIFGLINLIVVCRPVTFQETFHWGAQPYDLVQQNGDSTPLFCEGTPAIPSSYWGNLLTTMIIALIGFAITPFWPLSWFLGYYFWFNSIYYQCLAVFPFTYNYMMRFRKKKQKLQIIILGLILLSYTVVLVPGLVTRNISTNQNNSFVLNTWALHFALFGPFWMVYFIIGVCLAFLYDTIKPANIGDHRKLWGWIADICTLSVVGLSVWTILKGPIGLTNDADDLVKRLWATVVARLVAPLTTLWVFALSTGQGCTAKVLRDKFLINSLSPNTYSCFLFHQMVAQVYFAITRPGSFWNFWSYRENFYWFSPQPLPVEWYEFFLLVGLTTYFSHLMHNLVLPFIRELKRYLMKCLVSKKKDDLDDLNV